MRLVLLISLFTATVQADPITVTETRSAGGVTDLFYSYEVSDLPGPVTAFVRGDASCPNAAAVCDQPATAAIRLTMDLFTSGPVRDGTALMQLSLGYDGITASNGRVSGIIGPYALDSCAKGLDCLIAGYFPFELGVPFTVDLSGLANGGAAFQVRASLQLFEFPAQSGDPVGRAVQISLVPEPTSRRLALTGLAALLLFALNHRRNLRPF